MEHPARPIDDVLRDHKDALMQSPGVVGVGVGRCDGDPCIKIFITEAKPAYTDPLPATIEGYKVDIVISGEIHAL